VFSCRKASMLVSASLDRPLSRRERIAMRLHLAICVYCRRFVKQARFLQQIGAARSKALAEFVADVHLPAAAAQRIEERLRRDDES